MDWMVKLVYNCIPRKERMALVRGFKCIHHPGVESRGLHFHRFKL